MEKIGANPLQTMVLLLLVEEDFVQLIYSPQSTTIHQIFSCPFRVQLQIDYASLVACRVVYCGGIYCTALVVIVVVVDFILSPDTEFANLIILFIRRADEGQDWAGLKDDRPTTTTESPLLLSHIRTGSTQASSNNTMSILIANAIH